MDDRPITTIYRIFLVPPVGLEPTLRGFKEDSVGTCNQRKQVAEGSYIACEMPYFCVASTVAVRLRYGYESPPVAYTPRTSSR